MVETFDVDLQRVRCLSGSTRDFRFVRADKKLVSFKPGQFYRFTFEDAKGKFERSYSLCNLTDELGDGSIMDLVISTVVNGRASQLLFSLDEGEQRSITASVKGPFGRLLVPKQLPKRLFLVATSVGIAPYMPMLWQLDTVLANQTETFSVHFLYGARDRSEFVYGDELLAFAKRHSNFDLSVCYSRESIEASPDDQSSGLNFKTHEFEGYVTDRIANLSPNSQTDHVLLCGNPKMVDDVFELLKIRDFSQRQVVREKYVFATESTSKKAGSLSAEQKKLIAEKMKQYQSKS